MLREQRRTERAAAVARRRLHEQILERRLAQDATVGDAVQRHAAGQAEAVEAGLGVQGARHGEHDLLGAVLDAGGDVGVVLVALGDALEVGRLVAEVTREARLLR